MTSNNKIFAAILGTNPQIVTESIFAILQNNIDDAPTEVHIMSTSVGVEHAIEKLINESWLTRVYQHFDLNPPKFIEENCITFHNSNGKPLEDIRTHQDSENAADTIFNQIAHWCETPNSQLHLSVGGGRKSLDLHAGLAMNICSNQNDRMSQVLVSDPRIENNRDFFFPSQPINQQVKSFQGEIIDTKDISIDLVYIDYIRLRGNLPKNTFCSGKSRLEIIAMGRRIFEKQTLTINYTQTSLDLSGEMIRLSTAPFSLYSWIVEEKLKGKIVISTAYKGSSETITTALAQLHSFKSHIENKVEKYASTDPRTDKTLAEIETILIGEKVDSSHADRLKGVEKWAGFKTKNINRVKEKINKALKDKTLSDLYAIQTFNAQGQVIPKATSDSGVRHDIQIKVEDIEVID